MRCVRCGTDVDVDWQERGVCAVCIEYSERRKRKEAAKRRKFRGELPGKPLPYWPPPFSEAAADARKLIQGKE